MGEGCGGGVAPKEILLTPLKIKDINKIDSRSEEGSNLS